MSTPVTYNVSDEAKAILVERLNLVGKEDLDKKADLDNPEQSICAKKLKVTKTLMTGEYLAGTDIPLATSGKYKDTAELAPWFVSADTPESKITQHYPYIYIDSFTTTDFDTLQSIASASQFDENTVIHTLPTEGDTADDGKLPSELRVSDVITKFKADHKDVQEVVCLGLSNEIGYGFSQYIFGTDLNRILSITDFPSDDLYGISNDGVYYLFLYAKKQDGVALYILNIMPMMIRIYFEYKFYYYNIQTWDGTSLSSDGDIWRLYSTDPVQCVNPNTFGSSYRKTNIHVKYPDAWQGATLTTQVKLNCDFDTNSEAKNNLFKLLGKRYHVHKLGDEIDSPKADNYLYGDVYLVSPGLTRKYSSELQEGGSLYLSGATTYANGSSFKNMGQIEVNGTAEFNAGVRLYDHLEVKGKVELENELQVAQSTKLKGGATITGGSFQVGDKDYSKDGWTSTTTRLYGDVKTGKLEPYADNKFSIGGGSSAYNSIYLTSSIILRDKDDTKVTYKQQLQKKEGKIALLSDIEDAKTSLQEQIDALKEQLRTLQSTTADSTESADLDETVASTTEPKTTE